MRKQILILLGLIYIACSSPLAAEEIDTTGGCPSGHIRFCIFPRANISIILCRATATSSATWLGLNRDLASWEAERQKIKECGSEAMVPIKAATDIFLKIYKSDKPKAIAMKRYYHSIDNYMGNLAPETYETQRSHQERLDRLENEIKKNELEVNLLFD